MVERNFIWRILDKEVADDIGLFNNLALTKGKANTEILTELIQNWNEANKVSFTLVGEKVLLERLVDSGMSVARGTLMSYRRKKTLLDEDGNPLWFTDGSNICYNLEGCISFFQKRNGLKEDSDPLKNVA